MKAAEISVPELCIVPRYGAIDLRVGENVEIFFIELIHSRW